MTEKTRVRYDAIIEANRRAGERLYIPKQLLKAPEDSILTTVNEEELTRLEALTAAATAGPCRDCTSIDPHACVGAHGAGCGCACHRNRYTARRALESSGPEAVPALVAEVRRLEGSVACHKELHQLSMGLIESLERRIAGLREDAELTARVSGFREQEYRARADAAEAVIRALPRCLYGDCGRPATCRTEDRRPWCDEHRPEWASADDDLPHAAALRSWQDVRRG